VGRLSALGCDRARDLGGELVHVGCPRCGTLKLTASKNGQNRNQRTAFCPTDPSRASRYNPTTYLWRAANLIGFPHLHGRRLLASHPLPWRSERRLTAQATMSQP
jgi:hypothetical protein